MPAGADAAGLLKLRWLSMRRSSPNRNCEISSAPVVKLAAGGSGKAIGRTPDTHAGEKPDACVVPMNDQNNGTASKPAQAEGREGKRAAKSNTEQHPAPGLSAGPARRSGSTVYVNRPVQSTGFFRKVNGENSLSINGLGA